MTGKLVFTGAMGANQCQVFLWVQVYQVWQFGAGPSLLLSGWVCYPSPQRAAVGFFLRLHVCTACFLLLSDIGGLLGGWVPASTVALIQSCKPECLLTVYSWLGVQVEFVSCSGTVLMGDGFRQGGCPCFIQCEQREMLLFVSGCALTVASVDASILCSLFQKYPSSRFTGLKEVKWCT